MIRRTLGTLAGFALAGYAACAPDPKALEALVRQADAALDAGPFSVMDKTATAPSGDKHDYFSLSPFHWPNPDTPDGKPYVYRDGWTNPEADSPAYDRGAFAAMTDTVETLCLAYRHVGTPAYAERAARLLRVWFLDPDTRMNPNLEYAEYAPGLDRQPPWGIIRGRRIVVLVNAADALVDSGAWRTEDGTAWTAWLSAYLEWLLESEKGKEEARAWNNHGTWYDVQAATLALRCGRPEVARRVLGEAGEKRIADHIRPDGKQTKEIIRTKSWDYSVMNLEGLFELASLGEQVDVDLWHFTTPDGRCLRAALDYLAQFVDGKKPWPHAQIRDFQPERLYPLLRRAAVKYDCARYRELAEAMAQAGGAVDRELLRHPAAE